MLFTNRGVYMNIIDNIFYNFGQRYGYGFSFLFILFLPLILCVIGFLARIFYPDKPKFLKRCLDWFDSLLSDY